MATTYHAAIQELYVAYFNRPADVAGLNFWETVLEGNGGDLNVVAAAFAAVPEYTTAFTGMTNAQIVAKIYINLFGHPGDEVGMKFWVDAMAAGNMTVSQAVKFIADGAQGTDAEIVENKVVAASAFTAALDTPAEQAGYAGTAALALAKAFIAGVTNDATLAAATTPAALNASVAAVVKAGTPFTLAGGLAALIATQDAKAAFLEAALDNDTVADEVEATALDADAPTDEEIETAIATVAAQADLDIDAVPGMVGYSAASVSVRAAKLALVQAENAEVLADAEVVLAAAQKAVADMPGLTAAIAELARANDAEDAAIEAAALADVAVTTATSTFNVKNSATLTVNATGYTDGAATPKQVVTANANGTFKVTTGVDATKLPGLTEFVAALNAKVAADAAETAAIEAQDIAELNVHYMDAAEASEDALEAVADAFVFQTAAIADKPSAAEIATEVEAFTDLLTDLDDAAATNGDTDYTTAIATLRAALAAEASATARAALTAAAKADGYLTTADKTAIDASANAAAAATALDTHNWNFRFGELDDAIIALNLVEGAAVADDLVDDLDVAVGDVDAAETTIETLADAVAEFNAVEEINAGLTAQIAAITAAMEAFEENDFAAPIIVDGIKFGTLADDVFVAASSDAEIKSFGSLGEDSLYIGNGFTLNASGDLDEGVDTVKEVFFVEDGADTIVYLETSVFGSSASTPEVVAITLTGVSADDLVLSNGFITFA